MKLPAGQRRRQLSFNITPLIDMTFLLIIFFLVASYLVRNETAEAVQLPEAVQVVEEDVTPPSLTVTVTPDEQWHALGTPRQPEEIAEMIHAGRAEHGDGYELRIRADRSVPYRVVEPLLLMAARGGVTNVQFAVIAQ